MFEGSGGWGLPSFPPESEKSGKRVKNSASSSSSLDGNFPVRYSDVAEA
jgi:hypothetical protein